ncbi:hypothetical protein J2T14_004662 [Paenibacillus harenae]|nr:hypothetical protein [Paenibacillus harenae]
MQTNMEILLLENTKVNEEGKIKFKNYQVVEVEKIERKDLN